LRHTSITQAAELGQKAGLGLDKIRAHSRHSSIATLMLYVDEHDRQRTQQTLATSSIVAGDRVSTTVHTAVRRCLTRNDPRSNARPPTMKTLLITWEGVFAQSGRLLR